MDRSPSARRLIRTASAYFRAGHAAISQIHHTHTTHQAFMTNKKRVYMGLRILVMLFFLVKIPSFYCNLKISYLERKQNTVGCKSEILTADD